MPRSAPSIRRVVATTMLVPVLALTVSLVALASLSARTAAERTGAGALRLATTRVRSELQAFLGLAERLSDYAAARLRDDPGILDDAPARAAFFGELMRAFPSATVCVAARDDGSAVGAIRDPDGLVLIEAAAGAVRERRLVDAGPLDPPLRSYDFDPRERPWFVAAQRAGGQRDAGGRLGAAHWTPPYPFVRRDVPGFDVGTSYVRLLLDRDGAPFGVLAVDVTFDAISRFLRETSLGALGELMVVDSTLAVLATSRGSATADDGARVALSAGLADALATHLARERDGAAQLAPERDGAAPERPGALVFTAARGGEELLVATESLPVAADRDWHVVGTVPQRALLREARRAEVWLLIFSAIALATAVGGLLWLVARVTRPFEKLQRHVQRLGAGEFPEPIDLRASRELETLSRDLNRMSTALRERNAMQRSLELAREVQQALIPPASLERPGLSLLGHIDYCDSAGGDYFDYIELPGRDAVLVAVGDVMGHGIASTILMATARAALRTEVRRSDSLGAMLLRVSSVLLQGGRHGRFMTMFLLLIEPGRRRIRWANAGHDAGLVVRPGSHEPIVLGGGDIPLGIDEGVVYFEHSMDDLPPGSLVYVGTDGIREAHATGGEEFGDARLQAALGAIAGQPLPAVRDGLLEAVRAFRRGEASKDDLTMVLARIG